MIKKIMCPACLSRLKVTSAKKLFHKLWLTCPRCGERFQLQSPELISELEKSIPKRIYGRGSKQFRPIYQLREKVQDGLKVVLPGSGLSRVQMFISLFMLFGLVMGLLIYGFGQSGTPAPENIVVDKKAAISEVDSFRMDMVNLKKGLVRRRHVEKEIDYKGLESRIAKFCLANLLPDRCREIVGLRLWSARPQEGFMMQAECADRKYSPELVFNWTRDRVRVSVPANAKSLEITLDIG